MAAFTTGPALACPRNLLCLVEHDVTAAREVPRAAKPTPRLTARLDVRRVTLSPRARLGRADTLTFDPPPKPDPSVVEMPWIWKMLRERVVSQMPSHRSRGLTLTMSPVVVTTPSETVPGLGVGGDF